MLLNTWGKSAVRHCHTFCNGATYSQLDFLGTRRLVVDSEAKTAKPIALSLTPWRQGPQHWPVCGSLKWSAGWTFARPKRIQQRFSLELLRQHIKLGTPQALELQSSVDRIIADSPGIGALAAVNRKVLQVCNRLFPRSVAPNKRPGQSPQVAQGIRDMWQAYAITKMPVAGTQFQRSAERSRRHCQFQQRTKELRALSRGARKQWLVELLQEAEVAAAAHNMSQVYKIINIIAPRRRREQVRIKGLSGQLLRKGDEYRDIDQYFSKAFSASEPSEPIVGVALTPDAAEISQAVLALKGGKAVPQGSMPADIWKLCSRTLSGLLADALNNSISTVSLPPSELADCELSLLPKPGKVTRRPQDLRPLGLQDPSAKVYAIVIRERLLGVTHARILASNQYAYCPGKSIDLAVAKVASFCFAVRERVRVGVLNVHQRRAGQRESSCYGGAMLSLDLSRAFDTLTRSALESSLQAADVPEDLCHAILQIHNQCRYTVRHHAHEGTFPMEVGVRQGCALSPLLYTLYTVHLMERIAARTSTEWVRAFFTAFADDKHLAWRIETVADLSFLCHCVRVTIELLASDGMQVNYDKSKLVLALRGSAAARWTRKHSRKTPDGPLVNLGTPHSPIWVPRVGSFVYLGVVASFQGFEMQTLRHRLQAAAQNKHRLLKVLHNKVLTVHERVRLYCACVRSALLYVACTSPDTLRQQCESWMPLTFVRCGPLRSPRFTSPRRATLCLEPACARSPPHNPSSRR